MNILFIGDIFGKTGRDFLALHLPQIKNKYQVDLVIANAENCTHGKGLNWEHFNFLKKIGIDFFTMGNHTWSKSEVLDILENEYNIIRPLNLDDSFQHHDVGSGTQVLHVKNTTIRITNLLGSSVALPFKTTNPFHALAKLLTNETKTDIHIVDFHAETTSEKNAFGVYFDGQVSAILGTHTHVPTNDLQITPKQMVFCSDVGMCGPGFGSVIGAKAENAIACFLGESEYFKLEVSQFNAQLNAVFMQFDNQTFKPIKVEQIRITSNDCQKYLQWKYLNPYKNNN